MFSGKKVKELLDASPYRSSDLAEFLSNNKKRSMSAIFSDDVNPRADTLEKLAAFFHVSIDTFFVREDGFESRKSNEELTRELWETQMAALKAENDMQKKQIELLEELRDELKQQVTELRARSGAGTTVSRKISNKKQ